VKKKHFILFIFIFRELVFEGVDVFLAELVKTGFFFDHALVAGLIFVIFVVEIAPKIVVRPSVAETAFLIAPLRLDVWADVL
jgi:hypothetical protein